MFRHNKFGEPLDHHCVLAGDPEGPAETLNELHVMPAYHVQPPHAGRPGNKRRKTPPSFSSPKGKRSQNIHDTIESLLRYREDIDTIILP